MTLNTTTDTNKSGMPEISQNLNPTSKPNGTPSEIKRNQRPIFDLYSIFVAYLLRLTRCRVLIVPVLIAGVQPLCGFNQGHLKVTANQLKCCRKFPFWTFGPGRIAPGSCLIERTETAALPGRHWIILCRRSRCVRFPMPPSPCARWDRVMDAEHYLGFRWMFGHGIRHVATGSDGEWLALPDWCAGAFKVKARDAWIGWTPEQQFRRLRLIANNCRFLVLPRGRAPNLAELADWGCGRSEPELPEPGWLRNPFDHLRRVPEFRRAAGPGNWRRCRRSAVRPPVDSRRFRRRACTVCGRVSIRTRRIGPRGDSRPPGGPRRVLWPSTASPPRSIVRADRTTGACCRPWSRTAPARPPGRRGRGTPGRTTIAARRMPGLDDHPPGLAPGRGGVLELSSNTRTFFAAGLVRHGRQQPVAAEHIQRQIAVAVVILMEETAFLHANRVRPQLVVVVQVFVCRAPARTPAPDHPWRRPFGTDAQAATR